MSERSLILGQQLKRASNLTVLCYHPAHQKSFGETMPDKKIVVLGGGFGGLFTALELAGSGDVTLVSDEDHFLFTPMLYEYLSGEVEEWHIAPRYDELLDNNIHFVQAEVT